MVRLRFSMGKKGGPREETLSKWKGQEETGMTFTIVLLQKTNDLLQHGGFVHFPCVARKHGAKFLNENIELVPTLLLRLVSRSSVKAMNTGHWVIPLRKVLLQKGDVFHKCVCCWDHLIKTLSGKEL